MNVLKQNLQTENEEATSKDSFKRIFFGGHSKANTSDQQKNEKKSTEGESQRKSDDHADWYKKMMEENAKQAKRKEIKGWIHDLLPYVILATAYLIKPNRR